MEKACGPKPPHAVDPARNDANMPCYLTQDVIDGGPELMNLLRGPILAMAVLFMDSP